MRDINSNMITCSLPKSIPGIYTHRSQMDMEDLEDEDHKPKFERKY